MHEAERSICAEVVRQPLKTVEVGSLDDNESCFQDGDKMVKLSVPP